MHSGGPRSSSARTTADAAPVTSTITVPRIRTSGSSTRVVLPSVARTGAEVRVS